MSAVSEAPDRTWPSVSVVVPTRQRPRLMHEAVRSVLSQDYPGSIECVVVFDQSEPHPVLVEELTGAQRWVTVLTNDRKPGLAGARNSGVLAASGEIIGHCDDDDVWLPGKLHRQLTLWREVPDAPVVASGLTMERDGSDVDRPAPPRAGFADFLASRIMEIHSSALLVRRSDMVGRIGLIDEDVPYSFGEDYEWLLRASRHGDVVCVPDPLVRIDWSRPSFYLSKWTAMIEGLRYILRAYPQFATVPKGLARVQGQIAFAYAASGERAAATRWSLRALRNDPAQLRAFGALVVAAGLVSADRLVRRVQATGRGL